jgi:signal transduction histidine kinase
MGRRPLGLRTRLLGALVLTAVVSLLIAALALLPPLEQRLRNDGENSVLNAVAAAQPRFQNSKLVPQDRGTGLPNASALLNQMTALRRATGAQVSVFDQTLEQIAITGPDDEDFPDDNYNDVARALATQRENYSLINDALIVSQPIRIGGRLYGLDVRKRLSYVASAVDTVQNAFLEAAGAGLLVALLLGIGLSGRLLRRLDRLRDATQALERDGPDAAPPSDAVRDEIGDLSRSFARMHERLRLQEDARRAFVATASHELRTPLASLSGILELLEDDLSGDNIDIEDARERTARAMEQSRRLSALATDLLDLSRLDAEVDLRVEPLELGELCRAVAAEFELRAKQAQVHLDIRFPAGPCWVSGDPGSVARIIRILIDNALRVSPAQSAIHIETSHNEGWASAVVYDEGPGVPEPDRQRIFERFQRGSTTAGQGGFGLGLAIGRELAVRMNGELRLSNGSLASGGQAPGPPTPSARTPADNGFHGARFELRLPLPVAGVQDGDGS